MLELVDELILAVVEQIDDLGTLRSLASTCARLQGLAEPAIYRDVFLRSRRDALALTRSIVSRPERLNAIRCIEARQEHDNHDCRLGVLVDMVRRARNLQELTVESPFCNRTRSNARRGWAEEMAALLRPVCDYSIPRLTSLTLHLSLEDKRYWSVDQSNILMFAHPTVKNLKLSCATLGDDVIAALENRLRTPLENLALIECNITQKALRSILALPTALQRLSLGENCVHDRSRHGVPGNYNRLYVKGPVQFLTSLQQQHHSLKSLGYATNYEFAQRSIDLNGSTGLSTFADLSEISLYGCCTDFQSVLKSRLTAPPALRRLTFAANHVYGFLDTDVNSDDACQSPWFLPICKSIPTLRTLSLVSWNAPIKNVRDLLAGAKAALTGEHTCVRLYKRNGMAAIPPFLHGEKPYLDEEMGCLEDGEVRRVNEFKPETFSDDCLLYS